MPPSPKEVTATSIDRFTREVDGVPVTIVRSCALLEGASKPVAGDFLPPGISRREIDLSMDVTISVGEQTVKLNRAQYEALQALMHALDVADPTLAQGRATMAIRRPMGQYPTRDY